MWRYSGVRPLYDEAGGRAQDASRDYVLKPDAARQLLTVYGGKLTTYRRLSEQAVDMLGGLVGKKGGHWTERAHLPGGDFPVEGFEALVSSLAARFPGREAGLVRRLARLYGTRAEAILSQSPGENFGHGLYAAELDYLIETEWAQSAADILWRRTKLGLRLSDHEVRRVEAHVGGRAQ